ncbi:MAG: hypothetical protein HC798_00710 [Polaribacter sp.]|nr:hypothetical protein [Polaribacter sp.]
MKFGSIAKNLTIDADYGAIMVKELKDNFEKVDISSQYTSVRIDVNKTISFTFDINLQYAIFKSNLSGIEYFKKISNSSKNYYQGSYGNSNQKGLIKIQSQYGGVSINEK